MCTKCWLCFTPMFRQWDCLLERLASTHSLAGEPAWRVNPGMAVPSVWRGGKWGASKLTSDAWSSDSNATCMHSVYFFKVLRSTWFDFWFDSFCTFHNATFCHKFFNILLLFDKLWYSTFIAWMERPEFAALVKFSKESCCTPLPLQMRP